LNQASGCTVLAIDDSEDDVLLLEAAARSVGATLKIRAVRSGPEGLEHLRECWQISQRPDLILLDLNMPGMTGIEFLKAMRAASLGEELVVVVFSSSQHEKDIREAYANGADFYLMKPLDFAELSAVVRALEAFLRIRGTGRETIGALPCYCSELIE